MHVYIYLICVFSSCMYSVCEIFLNNKLVTQLNVICTPNVLVEIFFIITLCSDFEINATVQHVHWCVCVCVYIF